MSHTRNIYHGWDSIKRLNMIRLWYNHPDWWNYTDHLREYDSWSELLKCTFLNSKSTRSLFNVNVLWLETINNGGGGLQRKTIFHIVNSLLGKLTVFFVQMITTNWNQNQRLRIKSYDSFLMHEKGLKCNWYDFNCLTAGHLRNGKPSSVVCHIF